MINRRSLITGLISFAVTAPAIVRAGSLMPIKVIDIFDPYDGIFLREILETEYNVADFAPLNIFWRKTWYEKGIFKQKWIKNEDVYISDGGDVTIDHS